MGESLLPQSPPSNPARELCEEQLTQKPEAKKLLSTSTFYLFVITSLLLFPTRESMPPVDALIETFLFLFTPCQVQFQLSLSDPIPTQPISILIPLPVSLSLLQLPVHFLLAFHFEQQVLVQPC